ncbi:MAG TPA: hypothetical protein VMB79_07170 [Jatrophihabitans sp.]|nr:hypothetical protein [Jatrophihabitans sp.]
MSEQSGAEQTWCPSGVPNAPEAVVLGVRASLDGRVSYLAEPVPAGEVLGQIPEGIAPTRVLRFASHCSTSCRNRDGASCTLVERIVLATPPDEEPSVPRCHLRAHCQWWQQKGVAACQRCPAVATAFPADNELMTLVADPSTTLDQLEAWIAESA